MIALAKGSLNSTCTELLHQYRKNFMHLSLRMFVGISCLGLVLLAGCGESAPKVIKGKVTLDGQPVDGANLQLMPAASNTALFSGISGADGSFAINVPAGTKWQPGTYKVTANKYVANGGGAPAPGMDITQLKMMGQAKNSLPAIYETPEKTPVKVELKSDTTSIDVPLKSQ